MSMRTTRLRLGLLCGLLAFAVGVFGSSQHRGIRLATFAIALVVYVTMLFLAPRFSRSVAVTSIVLAVGGLLPPYDGRRIWVAALSAAEVALSLSSLMPLRSRSTDQD